ncbi:MAG: hypothetical protein KDJ37_15895 [Hyphomicrobiaceae bacterium]|nr:hypothetical protein [Hyphomicrobiaceae bacterium]
MEGLVRALLADGWFASLQHLPTGWCVLTDAPPNVMARLAARQRVEVIERVAVGLGRGYTVMQPTLPETPRLAA